VERQRRFLLSARRVSAFLRQSQGESVGRGVQRRLLHGDRRSARLSVPAYIYTKTNDAGRHHNIQIHSKAQFRKQTKPKNAGKEEYRKSLDIFPRLPALELREVESIGVGHRRSEVVARHRLPVVALI